MNILSRCIAICIVVQFVMTGCRGAIADNEIGGIRLAHVSQADSLAFAHDAHMICIVKSSVDAYYPEYYINDTLTGQIQTSYIRNVLNVTGGDSTSMQNALGIVIEAQIRQFGDSEDEVMYGIFPDKEVLHYSIVTDIAMSQAKGGIATFCKREIVNKDGEATVDTHHYINLDLTTMSKIDVYDLFAEDALPEISSLLKKKLLEQLNVKDEEELIGEGYFNLDNIMVNNNFYFGERGVTWNYVTYEIACYSVGETQITLGYDELSPFISRESILYSYLKKA